MFDMHNLQETLQPFLFYGKSNNFLFVVANKCLCNMFSLNSTFLQYMITVGLEGSIAEVIIDMLLAQDAKSEEKPLIIKIEENVIEKISSKDTHVSLF